MKVDYNELKIKRCAFILDPGTATLAAGAIGAGSNLLGNIFGFGSNKKTNETNYKIAQMNNEFNERMLQKQIDYNTEMWNKENEYNTAANQRKRLEEAGLNPYLMMNGGSAGTASSASGVTPPTADTSGTQQAFNPDFSGIGTAAAQAAAGMREQALYESQIAQQSAQTEGVKIENKYKAAKIISDLLEQASRTRNNDSQTLLNQLAHQLGIETFNSDVLIKQHQAEQSKYDALAAEQTYLYRQKEVQAFDKRLQYDLSLAAADIALKYSQGQLTKAQAQHELYKQAETIAKTKGVYLNNKQVDELMPLIVEKQRLENEYYGFDNITRSLWTASKIGGTAIDNLFKPFGEAFDRSIKLNKKYSHGKQYYRTPKNGVSF